MSSGKFQRFVISDKQTIVWAKPCVPNCPSFRCYGKKKIKDYILHVFSFSRRKKVKSKAVAVLKEVKEEGSYVEPPLELEESDDLDHRKEIVHDDLDHQSEIVCEDLDQQREIVHAAIVHKEATSTYTKNSYAHRPVIDDITTLDKHIEDDIKTIDRERIFFENRKRDSVIQAQELGQDNDIFIEDLEWDRKLKRLLKDDFQRRE